MAGFIVHLKVEDIVSLVVCPGDHQDGAQHTCWTLGIIRPLTLWLQSSPATADVTQLPLMVEHVVDRLNYISSVDASQKSKFTEKELKSLQFNKDNFAKKCGIITSRFKVKRVFSETESRR